MSATVLRGRDKENLVLSKIDYYLLLKNVIFPLSSTVICLNLMIPLLPKIQTTMVIINIINSLTTILVWAGMKNSRSVGFLR